MHLQNNGGHAVNGDFNLLSDALASLWRFVAFAPCAKLGRNA
jgi:hypothetical protein